MCTHAFVVRVPSLKTRRHTQYNETRFRTRRDRRPSSSSSQYIRRSDNRGRISSAVVVFRTTEPSFVGLRGRLVRLVVVRGGGGFSGRQHRRRRSLTNRRSADQQHHTRRTARYHGATLFDRDRRRFVVIVADTPDLAGTYTNPSETTPNALARPIRRRFRCPFPLSLALSRHCRRRQRFSGARLHARHVP